MKYKIDSEEKNIIIKFQNMRIPSILKTDDTDRILFVEDIDFSICNMLLNGEEISEKVFNDTLISYKKFCNDTDIKDFDEYDLEYYSLCMQIVEIMKKYYS